MRTRFAPAAGRARSRSSRPRRASRSPRHDFRQLLDEELNRLPDKYRIPVVLCYLEGKTNEEAASHLRWPTGTVKIRLSRARDRLRDRLTRRGLVFSAGALAALLAQQATATAASPVVVAAT